MPQQGEKSTATENQPAKCLEQRNRRENEAQGEESCRVQTNGGADRIVGQALYSWLV